MRSETPLDEYPVPNLRFIANRQCLFGGPMGPEVRVLGPLETDRFIYKKSANIGSLWVIAWLSEKMLQKRLLK